jgi:hypothetical protein
MPTSAVEVVPATLEHVAEMAPRMRDADRAEVWASCGMTPEQALEVSMATSGEVWAALQDGRVVCIWGVGDAEGYPGVGVPWLLGTDAVREIRRTFLRECRRYVAGWMSRYEVLVNFTDDRNTLSHQWLRWLGFTIMEPEPHGVAGLPFRKFYMVRDSVCASP